MPNSKITLTLDDLHSPAVEERLKLQAALHGAQAASTHAASQPSRLPVPEEADRGSLWVNTVFNMLVFGLLGGLLAWGTGELVRYFNPDQRAEARRVVGEEVRLIQAAKAGRLSLEAAQRSIHLVEAEVRDNPWLAVYTDTKITPQDRAARIKYLEDRDWVRNLFAEVCFYCACGTMIALALGMAESVASRNFQGAAVYGSVGTVLGLVGGIIVSLFADRLYHLVGGGKPIGEAPLSMQVFARALSWGVLGLFVSAAPGVVMRNGRKLTFGLVGGFVGGLVGGALFDPVARLTGSPVVSRLVAILAIGVITGVGTGLIENAAKAGWIKVVAGLIAGKQFIIYRNPTLIGSAPQCEIYLFKDGSVGRRHAALYVVKGGYDIEDLGTGSGTLVNGRRIARARLRSGDRVQVGSTAFLFQEKDKSH